MDRIQLRAYGKINLALDVVRKREDGYHEVRMVMQTVGIYDQIALVKKETPGISVKTNLFYLPNDENNLVYKAAKLLMDEFPVESGVEIHLRKYIPVAAGMAGGSSDAAAVLVGMNKLFNIKLSKQDLMERGVKIGADVPYCVMRGTALAEGIGEKLSVLSPMPDCFILLAKPAVSVSTKYVYTNLHLDKTAVHPDIDGMIKALGAGSVAGIGSHMANILETVTIPAYPVIDELKKLMKNNGAVNALMSGSGPTVFGIFTDRKMAQNAYDLVKKSGLAKQYFLTVPFNDRARNG